MDGLLGKAISDNGPNQGDVREAARHQPGCMARSLDTRCFPRVHTPWLSDVVTQIQGTKLVVRSVEGYLTSHVITHLIRTEKKGLGGV